MASYSRLVPSPKTERVRPFTIKLAKSIVFATIVAYMLIFYSLAYARSRCPSQPHRRPIRLCHPPPKAFEIGRRQYMQTDTENLTRCSLAWEWSGFIGAKQPFTCATRASLVSTCRSEARDGPDKHWERLWCICFMHEAGSPFH